MCIYIYICFLFNIYILGNLLTVLVLTITTEFRRGMQSQNLTTGIVCLAVLSHDSRLGCLRIRARAGLDFLYPKGAPKQSPVKRTGFTCTIVTYHCPTGHAGVLGFTHSSRPRATIHDATTASPRPDSRLHDATTPRL